MIRGVAVLRALLTMVVGCAIMANASAQDYPTRPVKLLLGFAAGGSGDFIARTIAESVGTQLGQPLVIENRPGADEQADGERGSR